MHVPVLPTLSVLQSGVVQQRAHGASTAVARWTRESRNVKVSVEPSATLSVPVIGRGDQGAPINKDIKPFLLYFLPKGCALDWHTMNVIVKGFHLAFKGMETEEIYDILMEQLVATIKGYDPTYTDKVKLLVEAIEHGLSTRKQFSFADVNRHLDFDCNRYIRLLGRLGFLSSEA